MSEIKTIKGKVLFGCVPMYNRTFGENGLVDIEMKIDEGKYEVICRLSEITEEHASLLVDRYNNCAYRDYDHVKSFMPDNDDMDICLTAKESLFSLFKVNDCLTKQMALDGSYYHAYIFDEVGQTKQQDVILRWEENNEGLERKVFAKPIEELPDDYLLIIKQ